MGYRVRAKPLGGLIMPRPQQNLLRPLTVDERAHLEHLSRSYTAPAAHVARAKALLAVAHLVARFNRDGLAALAPGHGGRQPKRYSWIE